MLTKRNTLLILFTIFVVIELGFQTWWNKQWGDYASVVAAMLASILTCYFGYRLLAFEKKTTLSISESSNFSSNLILFISIFSISAYIIGKKYAGIQAAFPVNPLGHGSDILPSLHLYVKRFLAGEFPYQELVFDGWTVLPTYFPMMWLPYCFSEILQIDYRWTAYVVFLIPIFIYLWKMSKSDIHPIELALKTVLPFVFIYVLMEHMEASFGYGVELMVIGLYLLLTLSIMSKSNFLIGLTIVIVLLSRYAFTFWLPVYLLIIWIERGFKNVFQVSTWVLVGVLAIYVIPFLSKDWEIFTNGFKYYNTTAETFWGWQDENGRPFKMTNGLSAAVFFFDFMGGTVSERLAACRMFHLFICLIAASFIFWKYFTNRNKGLNSKLYLIITLKFYLIIFYGFFYVPFQYLFFMPLLLGIPIIYHVRFFPWRKIVMEKT